MRSLRIVVFAIAGLACVGVGTEAHANINRQVRELRSSDNFKVRLSAALSLSKSRDRRAVLALAQAVTRDSSATIRRVAVDSLKKVLSSPLPGKIRRAGLEALSKAARSDRDAKVRRAAERVVMALTEPRSRGGAFVALGRPADPKRRGPAGIGSEITSTVSRALRRRAPALDVVALRDAPRRRGWFVGASISDLQVHKSGASTEVRCKVSLRVSPVLDRQERLIAGATASAKGSGRVVGGSTPSAVADSKRQCLTAVVEQVTEQQVVPFIQQQAGRRVAEN